MSRFSAVPASLSALALAVATPALADVTAAELWAEWQSQGALQGQVLSAEEVVSTDAGLTLRGFTAVFEEDDVRTTGRVEELSMVENGDGTVTVTMSELYDILVEIDDGATSPDMMIRLEMRQDGLNILAGGTVDARTYRYTADTITITDGPFSGGSGEPPEVELLIRMRDLTADYLIDGSDTENVSFESSGMLGTFTGALDVAPAPPEEGRLKTSFLFSDMTSSATGTVGSLTELGANPQELPEGFELDAEVGYGNLRYDLDFYDAGAGDTFQAVYTNLGGSMGFEISETSFAFNAMASGTEVEMTGSDIPVPIRMTLSTAEIVLDLPVAPQATPTPFAARLAYRDVTMGEEIWSLFDPGQAIPRDPITVIADISGAAQMMVNLLTVNPDDMDTPPGELRSLTINDLRVSAGGAELTGSGDLEFAPGQVVPMPVGQVDLALSGGNALMDRLAQSGLVPMEQMMMVRAMTGMFARQGAAPDTLESRIEFTPGGGITANGMPLQ